MSSRLVGAIIALTAAALLAASIVSSAWWAGHPNVDGRTITAKDVNVGLHGAEGCNTGGDRGCTELSLPGAFTATGYAELATSAILVILLILVAVVSQTLSERRKPLAWGAIAVAGLCTLIAIALILQGPKVKTAQHVTLPVGYGMILFFIGIVIAFVGSALALRPAPPLIPRPSRQPFAPGLAQQPPLDLLAMFPESAPAQPAPHAPAPPQPPPPTRPITQMPPASPMPASPGGSLAGPAGPLAGYAPRSAPPPSTPPPPRARPPSLAPPPITKPPTVPPPARAKAPSLAPPNKPRLTPPPPKPGEVAPPRLPEPRATDTMEAAMTIEHLGPEPVKTTPQLPQVPQDVVEATSEELETLAVERVSPAAIRPSESELETQARPKVDESELLEAVARVSASELETIAREKLSARELAVGDSTSQHGAEPAVAAPATPAAAIVPVSTAPASLPPPVEEPEASASGPSPACPQCEAPMGWVEEHLRFYCKSCRMYF